MNSLPNITPEIIQAYQESLKTSASAATAKRKSVSLNRFFDWAHTEGKLSQNPLAKINQVASNNIVIGPNTSEQKNKVATRTWATIGITAALIILIFLLTFKLKFPIPFTLNFAQEAAIQTNGNNIADTTNISSPSGSISANNAVVGAWNIYAKLKLTDSAGSPITGPQTLSYKIYNVEKDGTPLYTSPSQNVNTDSNGSILISLSNVPTDLFFQNERLYVEPILGAGGSSLRMPVSTASTPANLNGFFPSNPTIGATNETIPVINSDGSLVLASESPAIIAKKGNFLMEGQAVTLKTTDGGDGNIEINPDGKGIAHFLFEGNKGNFLNAQGPNLTSGSLYYGMVPNNATGYDLIRLQSGSPKMTTKFSVDALGNTYVASDLNVAGDIATGGVDRLTSSGNLKNITGYSQNSGNFTVNQNPGDFASIIKKGSALSDVLNLTLDERGYPNSSYSTLTLNRFNGAPEAAALHVDEGNAIFDGQIQLGRFSSNPNAIGQGSLVFNTGDNQVYVWNGSSWVAVGAGGSSAFSALTSGTNTTAAMVVGSGASLTFSGTGTITASDLICSGCVANSELANSSITFAGDSGTSTISLGGTENIVGTNSISTSQSGSTLTVTAANATTSTVGVASFDSNFFTVSSGNVSMANDSLDFAQFKDSMTLDAATNIALGALTLSTSGTGALNFASSGQVTFAGNVDATNGLDITTANLTVGGANFSVNQSNGDITTAGDLALNGGDITSSGGTTTIGNGLSVTGNTNLNGNTTLGDAITDGITFTGRASSSLLPIANNTYDLGSTLLRWANIYGTNLYQGGNPVCDSSGANCPVTSASLYWNQTSGALFPTNSSVDVLIGSSATTSAKFAFTGVSSGTPTASISGTTTNVATFIDGNGNISSTNRNNLTLGNSTTYNSTGNILLNPNGTGNVGIGDTTPVASLTVGSGDLFQVAGASGNITTAGDIAVNGGDITGTGALTVTPGAGTNLNIALSTTGDFAVNTNQLYVDTSTGNVGVGDATPASLFTVGSGDLFQIDSSGRIVKIDGVSHTIDDVTGDLTLTSNSTSVVVNDDLAVNGATSADITSTTTTASIFDSTVTTLTIGSAATSVGIGAATGTTSINNALVVKGDTTLGDAITDNITFTGRVAQDSDLIPITTTGTNDLGTALLPWDNIYGGTFTGNGSGLTNVNATTLDSIDSLQFLRSDTSDNFTSGTLTTDAGTTFDVNGDLVVSDANIAFDAASTTFTVTGNLIFGSNGASTGNIQIGSATPSTSPDLLVLDKKSDAGNPTGSTGAIFLNSSDKFMINENGTWKELCNKTDQACGTGTGSAWSALTTPTSNLSLSMGAYTTAFDWTVTGASSPWSMSLLNNAGSSTTQNFLTLSNSVTTQTTDVNTESLILLDNADTSAAGSTVVDNGILITNSGGIANAVTDAIDASASDIVNALNFGANVLLGTTGNIDMTNFDVVGSTGSITTAGDITVNGNTQLGNAITDTIDFQGRVLQDSDLIPITTTGTNDLGTTLLPWDNIYGVALYQNGNPVCDSSGANCPAGSTNYWGQNLGALFTLNNTVDVLFGSSATTSAKFAFTGVSSGTPTASISGTTTNVATFIDGNGNISSTNRNNITIGNSTTYNSTGDILLNPNGTGNVGIGDTTPVASLTVGSGDLFQVAGASGNITTAGDIAVNGGDITSTSDLTINPAGGQVIFADTRTLNVGGKTGLAYNAFANNADGPVSGAISSDNDLLVGGNFEAGVAIYTPTVTTSGDIQLNGGDLTTTSTTATLFNANATTLSLGGAATTLNIGKTGSGASSIVLAGGSADTGCTINGATGALTCSGDIATTATSGIQGWWQRNLGVVAPTNIGDDLTIGGISTASATFQILSTGRITTIEGVAHTIDDVSGNLTLTSNGTSVVVADDLAVNGATSADITSTTTTATIFDSTVTTLSLGGAATTLNIGKTGSGASSIVLAGGSADTGCTLDGSNGNLTCSGDIATTATSGIQGWWQRNLGVVAPTNIGDDLTIGGISTASATFQILSTGRITTIEGVAHTIDDVAGDLSLTSNSTSVIINDDLAVNGAASADITSTTTTATIFDSTVTTLSLGGAATTLNIGKTGSGASSIVLAGGSADTGCTINGATGALTCSGDIATTATSGIQGWWQRNLGVVAPTNIGDDLTIGGISTASAKFQVYSPTGNIVTAGDAAINGGDLTSTATTFNFDIGNTGTLNFRDGTNVMVAISDQGTTGRLAVSDSLQVGSLTTVAYSRLGTTAAGHTGNITTSADLMVSGDFELDGNLYLDGKNIYNTNGNAAIVLCTGNSGADCSTTSAQENTLSTGSWVIDNQVNVGEPVLALNNAKGGDLLVASASGTLKFKVANNGDVTLGDNSGTDLTVGGGTGKVDAGTIDPPYTINGKKFATFLSGIVGVKEEVVGQAITSEYVSGVGYRYLIDFNSLPEGSDLWLFGKATDIKTNIEKLVALLTPSDPTRVWYEVDKVNKRLAIYSARPTTISYRLTGPRFDHQSWSNTRSEDSVTGFVLNIPDVINQNPIVVNLQQMSDFAINKIQNGYYQVLDSGNHVVDGVESIGNFVAGNIKSGAITTSELATNSFQAAQGTIDNLLITSGLVTPNAKIALISPIPNTTDVTVKIGSAQTDDGKLAVQNNDGVEVASIDTKGNANFAGDVHSQNIDQIQSILNQVTTDQSFLSQVVNSSIKTASNSAEFTTLATDDLYVTGQAAVSSLSVATSIALGNDMVLNANDNSINSINEPLKIQSLALAPLEIMAGKVKINTNGDMTITGNLYVAGDIKSKGIEIEDVNQNSVAKVTASGSAEFSSLSTNAVVIAGAQSATPSAAVNGQINSNSTVGQAIIPAGTTEVRINNPKVGDYTLVYVTPTSNSENKVLYIKSKGAGYFTLGFSEAANVDVSFNWWIVATSE